MINTDGLEKIHGKYGIEDIGCYMDGSIRNSTDILEFIASHGFTPENFDEEFIDEIIDEGIDYLNTNWCDSTVYFELYEGDLVLIPNEDDY
jgi:hypothetical protein